MPGCMRQTPVACVELWLGTDCRSWSVAPSIQHLSFINQIVFRAHPQEYWPLAAYGCLRTPLSMLLWTKTQIKAKQNKNQKIFPWGDERREHPADSCSDRECNGVTMSLLGCVSSNFYVGCTMVFLNLRLQGGVLLAS